MSAQIAVIEDEADIREVMQYNLTREGFSAIVAGDGVEGLGMVRREGPSLVLLDLMLPGMDGLEVCKALKADTLTRDIPIIMVTAKGEEADVVLGLELGADDYVVKPFSPRELVARVRAALRRGPFREVAASRDERIVRDGLVVDAVRHEVRVDGALVTLTATEFRLLHVLAAHPGRVLTRDQIINRIIGEQAVVLERNIDVHVRAVRAKIGPYRDLIETVRGVGYRFRDLDD